MPRCEAGGVQKMPLKTAPIIRFSSNPKEKVMSKLKTLLFVCAIASPLSAQVINDPLNGSTTGTRNGGTFVAGGWRVDSQYNSIYWHIGTYSHGAWEYNVKGLPGNTCPGG